MKSLSAKEWLHKDDNSTRLRLCWDGLLEEWKRRRGYAVRLLEPRNYGGVGLRALHRQKRVNIAVIEKRVEKAWDVVVTSRDTDPLPIAMALRLRGGNYRD